MQFFVVFLETLKHIEKVEQVILSLTIKYIVNVILNNTFMD